MTASSHELYEFFGLLDSSSLCHDCNYAKMTVSRYCMYVVVAAGWKAMMSSYPFTYKHTVNHCGYPHLGKEETTPI